MEPESTVDENTKAAADEISMSIGKTLAEWHPRLMAKYKITTGQLSLALAQAHMMLLAGVVVRMLHGPGKSESDFEAKAFELVRQFQIVIQSAMDQKPDV